jgi:hypothetical protein
MCHPGGGVNKITPPSNASAAKAFRGRRNKSPKKRKDEMVFFNIIHPKKLARKRI